MSLTDEEIQDLMDSFPGGVFPSPPSIDYYPANVPTAPTSFYQSHHTTSPRPPSGFLRLMDELYPDDESHLSDNEWVAPDNEWVVPAGWAIDYAGLAADHWSDGELDDSISYEISPDLQ